MEIGLPADFTEIRKRALATFLNASASLPSSSVVGCTHPTSY